MIHTLVLFFIKSVACSALMLGYYRLFLRNRPMHVYNRFYLLFTALMSLLLPLLHFEWTVTQQHTIAPIFRMLEVTGGSFNESQEPAIQTSSLSFDGIMITLYFAVSSFLLALSVYRVITVLRIKRRYPVTKLEGIDFVHTDLEKAPFSFLNTLYWRDDMDRDSLEGMQIVRHEMTHIRQKHTLDKLFLQGVSALCWLNPFLWIIQKELSLIHEFIADEAAIDHQDTEAFACMLLQRHYGNSFRDVVHPFFHSSIKRRLTMLNQMKSTRYRFIRKCIPLPLLGIAVLLLSCKTERIDVNRVNREITLAVDAGHGGADNGATGLNGMLEKDLNLKVIRKLSQLAAQYNIKVVTVRSDDHYVPLQERAAIANHAGADIFLSMHVNSRSIDDNTIAGYEMIIDERSAHYNASRTLASAIASRMGQLDIHPQLAERHLVVLRDAAMPAVLIECGDIMNQQHIALLQDDRQLEIFCRNILNGIVDYSNNKG